jgi:hypothetical protein
MEHLLTGLLMKQPGPAQQLFSRCGVTRDDVIARLLTADKEAPEPGEGEGFAFRVSPVPIDATTPLSRHVLEAMTAALERARAFDESAEIQSRDLVLGMGSVGRCSVVHAFHDVFAQAPEIIDSLPNPKRDDKRQAKSAPSSKASDAPSENPVRQNVDDAPRDVRRIESDEASLGAGEGAGNDRPEQAEDRLEFRHYIKAFADLAESPDTRPPITIGIFGSWGAGKSFLLYHLQKELSRRERARRRPLADALRGKPLANLPAIVFRHADEKLGAVVLGLRDGARARIRHWADTLGARWRGESPPVLAANRDARRIHAVTFNAWEYSATERIWPRLVRAVLQRVEADVRWHTRPLLWLERVWRKLRYNFPRTLRAHWLSLAVWVAVFAAVGYAIALLPMTTLDFTARQIFGLTLGKEFVLPTALATLGALVKVVREPLGDWMSALLADGVTYGGQIDYMAAMKADLDLLERRLEKGRARVLVMIDDLDRCEPDKLIPVLQAVNLLLDRKSFIVCLGVDARIVTAAVDKHYRQLLGRAGVSGYEYLDKIVQIPFRIPEPTRDQLVQLLTSQLGDPAKREAIATTAGALASSAAAPAGTTTQRAVTPAPPTPAATGTTPAPARGDPLSNVAASPDDASTAPERSDEPLTFTTDELRAFTQVAPFLRPNPRHINRLINVYALVRSLTGTLRERGLVGGSDSTVRWLVLAAQWPYTVRQMLVRLDELLRASPPPDDGATWRPAGAVTDDGALAALLGTAALDDELRKRFDWEEARLSALVADSSFVTWNQLRLLRRYTLNFNPALEAELRATVTPVQPTDRRETPLLRAEVAQNAAPNAPATAETTPPQHQAPSVPPPVAPA